MSILPKYIPIKGGTYTMGETRQKVTVPDLYFARYPVTNRMYRKFVEATDHCKPAYWKDKHFNDNDQPVVGVNWHDAVAYCKWLTKASKEGMIYRLPKEEEWEWAASGGKRTYPWGDEKPDDQHANWKESVGQTTPVGSYPSGATPEGLIDMAGNVWEWTGSWYGELEKPAPVVRGGCWLSSLPDRLSCAYRFIWISNFRYLDNGFRVVRAV